MTNIIEFTNAHMASSIDVTFERRNTSSRAKHPCSGHFFGGVAWVDGMSDAHQDNSGEWISIIIDEWESWENDEDDCGCGLYPTGKSSSDNPHRIMIDNDPRLIVLQVNPYGATIFAWNTHGLPDGVTEKIRIELLDPRNLPLW